jgi:hypothetical protein
MTSAAQLRGLLTRGAITLAWLPLIGASAVPSIAGAEATRMPTTSVAPRAAVRQDTITHDAGRPESPRLDASSRLLVAARAQLVDEPRRPLRIGELPGAMGWSWVRIVMAGAAMVSAILLSLPLAIIYMRTKPAHEFDAAVLYSIVMLAATIAGILVVVEGSIARALSLAGVVSAVRFRSAVHDSNDAVYLLGTIAVGLAAGSHAIDIGLAISVVLSLTLLILWKARLDAIKKALLVQEPPPKAQEPPHRPHRAHKPHPPHEPPPAAPSVEPSPPHSSGDPHVLPLEATRPARLRYLMIETAHAERARDLVETFLEREAKGWQLDGASDNGGRHAHTHTDGRATLLYLVRFRKHSHPDMILERLKALGQSSEFTVHLEIDAGHAEPRGA